MRLKKKISNLFVIFIKKINFLNKNHEKFASLVVDPCIKSKTHQFVLAMFFISKHNNFLRQMIVLLC